MIIMVLLLADCHARRYYTAWLCSWFLWLCWSGWVCHWVFIVTRSV